MVVNEVPAQLIFNWDQTALHLVPTGQWTMNKSVEKVVPISNSDDKPQITAVLAVIMSGKYLPLKSYTKVRINVPCHPKRDAPKGWDIWHSENHRSNKQIMIRYIETILAPFLREKRAALKLEKTQPALATFDFFHGQTTPEF